MMHETTDQTIAERLRNARIKAGFASGAAAARHFDWGLATYRHHENGTRSIGIDQAVTYAKAFKVSASWLLSLAGPSETSRVPIAKFYVSVYAENLGKDNKLRLLVDQMYEILGLQMVPELSVDSERFEWIVGPNGLPPMHFIDPADVDVPAETVSDGYIFAYRIGRRAPPSRFAAGDLILVDSSVGEAHLMPGFYLLRDERGPFVKTLQRTSAGDTLLMPDSAGQIAESASDMIRFDVVGRVVWTSHRV